jgi:hypothetical protein
MGVGAASLGPHGQQAVQGPATAAAGAAAALKSERLLDYLVTSSSSLVVVPRPDLVLQLAAEANTGAEKHGGSGKVGGGAATARGAAGKGPPVNTLRLAVKPKGTGVYPAKITLTGPYDVRIIAVEVSAQCLGQSYTLELECPARQQVGGRQHAGCMWLAAGAADPRTGDCYVCTVQGRFARDLPCTVQRLTPPQTYHPALQNRLPRISPW